MCQGPKEGFFLCLDGSMGKILTCDNFIKRGYTLVGWCCMCCCSGETMEHLLLHCNVAFKTWSIVFRTFGLPWVLPKTVTEFLFGWWNWLGKIWFHYV